MLKSCSGRSESGRRPLETDYIKTLAEQLVRQPRTLYLEDITAPHLVDPSGHTLPEPPPFLSLSGDPAQIRSVMMVPLVVKDSVLGVLSIDHRKPKAFSQSEDRLLTIAAAQISTALDNARLYNDLEQHAAELESALTELREVSRLKAEFVQNVSHELRTPLTFVLAYVELIREGSLGKVPAEVQNKLTIISEKTRAITRLVDDVVSMQKIEAGKLRFEVIFPHQLVDKATFGASASAAEHQIDIVAHYSPDLPAVWVDVDRIGQVFDNLISNAIKFSPTGGKIKITATLVDDFIKFSVQDHGIGIPADKLERVFERFYQVDGSTTRRYGGTGLGLSIVKQIVEAHGGHVTVTSEPNENTIFSFFLPVYRDELQFGAT
jgi:signal transduction histidine kinase